MLISELILELEKIKDNIGNVQVTKDRAGTSIDHVGMYGVRCVLYSDYEYIGDDIVRFDIDYKDKDRICKFVSENRLLDLLYDYKKYGQVELKIIPKKRHQIHSINDNFYFLIVDITIKNKEDFIIFSKELEKQHIKDVKVNIKYGV